MLIFRRNPPLFFHGLKRSGNHVVLNWILSDGRFHFINNALPIGRLIERGRLLTIKPRSLPLRLSFGGKTLLISLEDLAVDRMLFKNAPAKSYHVVLVRDPENLFASRIRKGFQSERAAYPRQMNSIMRRAITIWKEHARLCLANLTPTTDTLGIYFDHWLQDPAYRYAIASWLKINPNEQILDVPAQEGGGSSFQTINAGIEKTSSLSSQVLHRRNMLNSHEQELLTEVLDDSELLELRQNLIEAVSKRQLGPEL